MFGKRKPQIETRTVTRVVYHDSPSDVALKDRTDKFLLLAHSEYARLVEQADQHFKRVEEKREFRNEEAEIANLLGRMTAVADSIALISGEDRVVVGFKLDQEARKRIDSGEEFPFNSYLSSGSPIFASKVR